MQQRYHKLYERAVLSVVEQAKLAHTLQCAVTALAGQTHLLYLAASTTRDLELKAALGRLLQYQESLEPWAKEVQDHSNHDINMPGLLNMWVTLEVLVEDLCVAGLQESQQVLCEFKKVNEKLRNAYPPDEKAATRIYHKTLIRLKDDGSVDAFIRLLSLLGLNVSLSKESIDHLQELNYTRNCVLHRGGVVESRKDREAPTLPFNLGDDIRASDEIFMRYYQSMEEFLNSLGTAIDAVEA